jgi:hypothetical protein
MKAKISLTLSEDLIASIDKGTSHKRTTPCLNGGIMNLPLRLLPQL